MGSHARISNSNVSSFLNFCWGPPCVNVAVDLLTIELSFCSPRSGDLWTWSPGHGVTCYFQWGPIGPSFNVVVNDFHGSFLIDLLVSIDR